MSARDRALAILLALLVLPFAAAQEPPSADPPNPQTPSQVDCQQPVSECFPDLMPTNPRVESTDERVPVTVCADFVNLGDGPAAVPFRFLFEVDGVGVGERQFEKIYRRGEGESNVCLGDLRLTKGRHELRVHVDSNNDVVETNESNNVRGTAFFIRPAPKVDLALVEFSVTPKEGGPGRNQIFSATVKNVGDERSPQTSLALRNELGPMATWPVPPLLPGQTFRMAHATRPEYLPVGTFVATARVDPEDLVPEITEKNNDGELVYTVLEHPAPDFVISNVTVQGNHTELRGVRLDAVVHNIGDRVVQGALLRIVNQTNETLVEGLRPGLIFPNHSATLQFYLVLRAGNHSLRIISDPYERVVERNESNNEWVLNLTITEFPYEVDVPNLIIERMYAMPADPRPGERVSVGALVKNIGTNRSAQSVVNFTVDGTPIGSASIPALPPGASHSAYVPWNGGPSATYTIRAVADPTGRLDELDESDNSFELDFLVTSERAPAEEKPVQPAPILDPPPVQPPPVPTPETPKPETPATPPAQQRLVFGEVILATNPVPGGLKGVISVSIRNPNIQPVGLLTVVFKIDGQQVKEVLVGGIRGAGTSAATSGELDLPPGKHTITAEARVVGKTDPPITTKKEYDVAAGEKEGVPGVGLLGLVAAGTVAVVLSRRRRV